MLLKYFYDKALAHASYLVGCQKTGEAIVIDPGRDVRQYLDAARAEGMRIVGAADTHIHADYVSGARQLADQVGAKLYLSNEGPADWKYEFAADYDHQLLRGGDTFNAGRIEFEVVHTPGHTPESVSFVLTDKGGGANEPMGIFTGDFVFVGSIGRPDLLEKAAGEMGTAAPGAIQLFGSVQRFRELPDFLQVWPAHGAGSACGKGLGAIPSSTVGYEKRFNPAFQIHSEDDFVEYILADQPEAPKYFAVMKHVNKVGPAILGDEDVPVELELEQVTEAAANGMVIDTRKAADFAKWHVPGSINIPVSFLAAWGGWLVDYKKDVSLLSSQEDIREVNRILRKIGIERIAGYFNADSAADAGWFTESYEEQTPQELLERVQSEDVTLIDVRGDAEWNEAHIDKAQRCFLADFPAKLAEFKGACILAFHCRSGARSAIAVSLAQAAGLQNVINMKGGLTAWEKAGLPVSSCERTCCGPENDASEPELACQSQAVFWNAECPVGSA
ncbi:MAG: rhodanese-like domain-containing protein [Planctomycetaceae bacterium]